MTTTQISIGRDALSEAIARDQLALYYQPTVSLTDGTVTGFEALVRWPRQDKGLLCAGSFVPQAESWGLIQMLDDWALTAACRQLAAWQEDALVAPGFRMAVNVSGAEVDGDGLVERVRGAITSAGVDPYGLVIEITESHRVENVDAALRSAAGLHDLGVEIALDDFGSEYGTFSRLNSFPFDVLKIDRAVVVASDSHLGATFVRALVALGNELGMRIIAEGIETEQQLCRLRALGAHEGQGFVWAPAFAASDATNLLTTGVWPDTDDLRIWCPSRVAV